MKILLFYPVQNQEIRIQPVFNSFIKEALNHCDEIIVINENSNDRSEEILKDIELPKLEKAHKYVGIDKNFTRSESLGVALEYAIHNNYEYIVMINEGWEDNYLEILNMLFNKEFKQFDATISCRQVHDKSIGSFFDMATKVIYSLLSKSIVRETKGDSINIFKTSQLKEFKSKIENRKSNDYFLPILSTLLNQKQNIFYTEVDNGLNYPSLVKLNTIRFFKSLIFAWKLRK